MFKYTRHKKYSRISAEKRSKFIRHVLEQRISVVKASKKLGIKISAAKLILKKYKETGTIFQKKIPNYKGKALRNLPPGSSRLNEVENGLRERSQATSMEEKLQRMKVQNEDCMVEEPFSGVYWYWPVFYYPI